MSSNAATDTRTPQADVAQDRNDPREQEAAEHQLELGVPHEVDDLGDREPGRSQTSSARKRSRMR